LGKTAKFVRIVYASLIAITGKIGYNGGALSEKVKCLELEEIKERTIMRKKWTLLAVGMAASLMMLSGCAASTGAETAAPAETVAETEEVNTEEVNTEEADTESADAEKTDVKNIESVDGETAEDGAEAEISSAPFRIWGTITDVTESDMTVDNQSPASSSGEMIFNIDPENTLVLEAVNGFPVSLEEVEKGSFEAYLGPVMTMSLPPQTTPYMVIVNIPADFQAPQYVIATGALEETGDGRVLKGIGGEEYKISEDAEIIPYLTRNIVTLEDIEEGSGCLVWLDGEDTVTKIVLFAK